ncbi:BZ3500_MvSof-1268-A1-R1_Chr11-1g03198 [Microbotryum saponariae]|uniref:BZ3500_MvSof-1268-A1-R1_Chr11-1g03198 protein n=1 Tax=Microbotryum saponariae TaxID=289078 RepID=A0A2X0LFP6_9BASI|nr:BZ3501_MvSof-1269-A2-R1_Chr11g02773 [Microbotryum saponariae]SDA03758.1 BZ3500_MvSof-1268-A1-R1_Chr11-1g03198 [Microbotryum saponariae]
MEGPSEKTTPLAEVFPSPFSIEDSQYSGGKTPILARPPYTLHEIEMRALSYSIRSNKADWQTKRLSREIRTKWAIEALEQSTENAKLAFKHMTLERQPLTFWMVDYVLEELEQHARVERIVNGQWREGCFDAIFESDRLIPDGLRSALIRQVAKLENVPEEQKDWHPGSKKQVLDLVHPSLYPLVYEQSVVRKSLDGEMQLGTTAASAVTLAEAPAPKPSSTSAMPSGLDEADETSYLSSQYQWLPSDFTLDENGGVSIDGYINNLHPDDHAELYDTIAVIFSQFVPLFDQTLSELIDPRPRAIPVIDSNWYDSSEFDEDEWMEEYGSEVEEAIMQDALDEAHERWEMSREITLPAPQGLFHPAPEEAIRRKIENPAFTIKGRTVQVIVKLANIVFTPDQPTYNGGVWHVEGMKNESIVATGIYYYDQVNIDGSSLAFRGTFDETELPYEQNDERGVEIVFGIHGDGPTVQSYNSAATTHNRCLTFPNIYQHRVPSFSLRDRTKPGHRKILVFFLVDPLRPRIPSTRDVAPQQRKWIERALCESAPGADTEADDSEPSRGSLINRLPNELWNRILDLTDGLMTQDEAKEHRNKLMFERKFKLKEHSTEVYEREFSLCEH